ncbi:MAG: hypothetical protein K6T55_12480 [Syntrophobacterales bacterium]|nr:hypothetical protein [Syntrophobacterales bacterium]
METWGPWLTALKAVYGLPLSGRDLELYRQATGLETPPVGPAREVYLICGRRAGKSRIAAAVAVYEALFPQVKLAPGEVGVVALIAVDRDTARVLLEYVRHIFEASPVLRRMVVDSLAQEIRLKNRRVVQVMTASGASVRGRTYLACVLDELAFFRNSEGLSNDAEIVRALRPGLATTGGKLIGLSSPYARAGVLWEVYRRHYGREGDILVWQAPTRLMNPTIGRDLIARDLEADPEAARAEWEAEFRSDLEAFLSWEALQAVVVPGRYELPPRSGVHYTAFVDPSGGRGDAAALAIAHSEGGKVVLDLARRWPAPHNPQAVIQEMAEVLRSYGVRRVVGDRYAGEWPRQEFMKHLIGYDPAPQDKSRIYLDFLPLVLSGRCELLDLSRLSSELRNLVRRPRSGGRDLVDHPPVGMTTWPMRWRGPAPWLGRGWRGHRPG